LVLNAIKDLREAVGYVLYYRDVLNIYKAVFLSTIVKILLNINILYTLIILGVLYKLNSRLIIFVELKGDKVYSLVF